MTTTTQTPEAAQLALELMTAERDELRRALHEQTDKIETQLGDLGERPDVGMHERKSSAFWYAAWKERNRQRAADALRIATLEAEVERLRCGDLAAFGDGDLEESRAAAFRDHLARCADCQKGLHAWAQLEARLSELAPPRTPKDGQ
jgi:hypothetical protein